MIERPLVKGVYRADYTEKESGGKNWYGYGDMEFLWIDTYSITKDILSCDNTARDSDYIYPQPWCTDGTLEFVLPWELMEGFEDE